MKYCLNHLIAEPDLIQCVTVPTVGSEEKRLSDELTEFLRQPRPDEAVANATAMCLASAQYDSLGNEEYETERLRRLFSRAQPSDELDATLLTTAVSAIEVRSDGSISIRLKNNQIIGRSENECRKQPHR